MKNENNPVELAKILFVVPEGEEDAGARESLWALPLGEKRYQIKNIPFLAMHLNQEDIVICDEDTESLPIISGIAKRGGHRTLRVIFREETPDDTCIDILWELGQKGISNEKVAHKQFMFTVSPTSDFTWAQKYLKDKEIEGLLWLYD